jgi:hypothetical protein
MITEVKPLLEINHQAIRRFIRNWGLLMLYVFCANLQ